MKNNYETCVNLTFPERRETWVPEDAVVLRENELYIHYYCRGIFILQDKIKDAWHLSGEFKHRMLMKLFDQEISSVWDEEYGIWRQKDQIIEENRQ